MKNAISTNVKWMIGIFLAIVLIAVVMSKYSTAIPLIIGMGIFIAFVPVSFFIKYLREKYKGINPLIVGGISVLLMLCILLFSPLFFLSRQSLIPNTFCEDDESRSRLELTKYSAEIRVSDIKHGKFLLKENIIFNKVDEKCSSDHSWKVESSQDGLQETFTPRELQSKNNGYFVKEVSFTLTENPQMVNFDNQLSDGEIVLRDFPKNTFYDAANQKDLTTDEYLGNETVTWTALYVDEGIRFAYLPPPFNNIKGLLNPFIEMSNSSNGSITIFGLLVGWVFSKVIAPSLTDWVKNKFKNITDKNSKSNNDSDARKSQKKKINPN
jgi:hypothetical protein